MVKQQEISLDVVIEIDGDEAKISLEEYFLIEAHLKELLQNMQSFDGRERD